MQFRVINKHLDRTCVEGGERVYVGRPGPLGNPFVLHKHGNREQVVAQYRDHLQSKIDAGDPAIIKELARILRLGEQKPVELSCVCAPAKCHADIIPEALIARKDHILLVAAR